MMIGKIKPTPPESHTAGMFMVILNSHHPAIYPINSPTVLIKLWGFYLYNCSTIQELTAHDGC
ncbi:hypothetical protein AmaxDRAFT_2797 [Limnospira maxima CS-328]|uniref:Uncharacterized protein n=1 Tax=Limnospira maxima CS-328 TaxID=513049 RepID=B5W1Z9_LIMMA|nr:hypothetical protein [Limnospira maxima]EDZ94428.1 hypothetical protein AmaxDRAFT_2797 [Limnospira maxima CS-328]